MLELSNELINLTINPDNNSPPEIETFRDPLENNLSEINDEVGGSQNDSINPSCSDYSSNEQNDSINEISLSLSNTSFNTAERKTIELNIVNANARSLNNKIESMVEVFEEFDVSVAVISETWFEDGKRLEREINDLENGEDLSIVARNRHCLLYTSPSPRDLSTTRMPSSA